jgi:hypothetical protein
VCGGEGWLQLTLGGNRHRADGRCQRQRQHLINVADQVDGRRLADRGRHVIEVSSLRLGISTVVMPARWAVSNFSFTTGDPRPRRNLFGPEVAAIRGSLATSHVEVRELTCVELGEFTTDSLGPEPDPPSLGQASRSGGETVTCSPRTC